MSIKGRLVALVGFLAVTLAITGGTSYYIASSADEEVSSIYNHETIPMRELATVRRLVVENSGQVFRAIQHSPGFEYAKLHNHPIDQHLDIIDTNLKRMNETFGALEKHLLPDSEELKILKEFQPLYAKYENEILLPTMASLRGGDYSVGVVARFLKENGAFEAKMNPLLDRLGDAQEAAVKTSYEEGKARNQRFVWIAMLTLVVGLISGLVIAALTIRSITGPLDEMQSLITRAAREKDFTGSIQVRSTDEIGTTANAFNGLLRSLQESLTELRQNIVQVDDATTSLAQASSQAAQASSETSESSSSMAASVEELSVSVTSVSDHTREALQLANTAGEYSESGGEVISNAVTAMADIAVQVRTVGSAITELGEHTERISTVVQVIKDVADQTNLLALNAAIEAARAGEQGRGFAVVADEVRKLAERTTKATGEIAGMIGDIQSRSKNAANAMEETIGRLESSSELAGRAGESIEAIRSANSKVQQVFADINEAMREQGAASYDIAQRVERVAQASEESSASVSASSEEAAKIHNLANAMRANIERFRV